VPDRAHPHPEELAAYQAGEVDHRAGARIQAHLGACAACTATIEQLDRVDQTLAGLPEPALPAAFHDRLAAALDAEPTRRVPRRAAWSQHPGAWGAAAAVLLVAAVLSALVWQGQPRDGGQGGTAATAGLPAPPSRAGSIAGGTLPVFRAGGDYTVDRLRTDLQRVPAMRAAYQAAATGGMAPHAATGPSVSGQGGAGDAQAQPFQARGADACVQAAARFGASRPALVIDGSYRGQPVRIVVALAGEPPTRLQLLAFPRADCAGTPAIEERALDEGFQP
jgi:hypothetical protein